MRSSRPTRCSATSGLHGRSKSTRRRQNSKLRPSPPHSVDTRRLGPPGRRNWATSMSRRAEDSASWKTPVATWARRLSPSRSHSSVSRWATKTSVFCPASRQRGRFPREPVQPRVRGVGLLGQASEPGVVPAEESRECGARSEGSSHAIGLLPAAQRVRCRGLAHRFDERKPWRPAAVALDGEADARGQPADVRAPRGARAGGELLLSGQPRLERLVLGEVGGPQKLEQAEEAVNVVVERDRGEEEQVSPERGDRRDRTPGRSAGVPGRAPQAVGLVHDEEVDAGLGRAGRELGPGDERLQGHDGASVNVERVEVGAVVPRDVGEPRLVEQDEHLVVLPPQLAEPLDGQGLGCDDQAPLGLPGPDEAAQDQAGLDRLAEPDLVGQQPAHGKGGGRALGRVELVGEEADPPAEEGAQPVGLPQGSEVERVEPQGEVLDGIDVSRGQPRHEVRAQVGRPLVAGCEPHEGRRVAGQAQRHRGGRELHPHRSALHGHHAPRPELRVVAVRQAVSDLPHGVHCPSTPEVIATPWRARETTSAPPRVGTGILADSSVDSGRGDCYTRLVLESDAG